MPNRSEAPEPIRRPAESDEVASSSPLGAIALFLLAKWKQAGDRGLLFISEDEGRAEQLGAILHALDPDCGVMVLPQLDTLPYDGMEPSLSIMCRRASVLRRLAERPCSPLLVMTPEAALPSVPSPEFWTCSVLRLRAGDILDGGKLEAFLTEAGYSLDERVETPGSALFHGQVVEVFPAGALAPVRIEHGEGRIVRISGYDPGSLEKTRELDEVALDLISEFDCSRAGVTDNGDSDPREGGEVHIDHCTVFEFAPRADIVRDNKVDERAAKWMQQIADAREGRFGPPSRAFTPERFMDQGNWEDALGRDGSTKLPAAIEGVVEAPLFVNQVSPARSLRSHLLKQDELGRSVVFTAATERDLRTMDRRAGGESVRCKSWADATSRDAKRMSLLVDLERGFTSLSPRPTTVVAAADVLGSRAARSNPFGHDVKSERVSGGALAPGDVVVHVERGVGILRGLETISAEGQPDRDMLRVEFADEASVLMPVQETGSLWRYGADSEGVALDKADGTSWQARRDRILRDISETASKLVALARERERISAPKIVAPVAEYERFASGFRFRTTPDQARAIEDVLRDLTSGRPMDRLICGDVGYGKTEVALRAAAAAAFAGKQVALAAPTTVLVRQHVETFRNRFAPFGIEIGHLSRFAKPAEAREVKRRLADGSLRIVVGTHAIAARGVSVNDLGLLIIDEEQRFGSADKTKFAALGQGAHVLTLTATPIPRTLGMANVGLRNLSVIATPPARRVPVKTVVRPFDDVSVTRALRMERRRGGQSFFVCPRIDDIAPMERRLREIVPGLGLRVVHGKMPADEIDETMVDFAAGKGDVLLTTNIIESGLDLPRANTIIVWRPDRFGLAQLHQLRGRVGRGNARAFAYFLTDAESEPTAASEKRLQTLRELSRAGAGFQISDRDLDLRGAGDLIGEKQAGHLKLIGPALYRRWLERAVSDVRSARALDDALPRLHIDRSLLLPSAYVADPATRLEIYTRLFKSASATELDELESEVEERFGTPPDEVAELFSASRITLDCKRLGVAEIDAGPRAIALTFTDAAVCGSLELEESASPIRWSKGRLIYERPTGERDRLQAIAELLETIAS